MLVHNRQHCYMQLKVAPVIGSSVGIYQYLEKMIRNGRATREVTLSRITAYLFINRFQLSLIEQILLTLFVLSYIVVFLVRSFSSTSECTFSLMVPL